MDGWATTVPGRTRSPMNFNIKMSLGRDDGCNHAVLFAVVAKRNTKPQSGLYLTQQRSRHVYLIEKRTPFLQYTAAAAPAAAVAELFDLRK